MAEKSQDKKVSKLETVKNLAEKLLQLLAIKADLAIKENEEGFNLDLQMENPAILIGYHGEALSSFQLILAMMVYQKLGEWVRLSIDVDGYRQRRQEILERMALAAVQKVRFSQSDYALPPMNARERRIIHLALAKTADIQTESQGEEPARRVVVRPK